MDDTSTTSLVRQLRDPPPGALLVYPIILLFLLDQFYIQFDTNLKFHYHEVGITQCLNLQYACIVHEYRFTD